MNDNNAIVAYQYGDQTLCPQCIFELFMPFDLLGSRERRAERILDVIAQKRGIDRRDTNSYSAYQFPVPIYQDNANTAEICGLCGRRLIGPPS